tara:strand:+ start:656 stop:898 length:243 start_codon:yes stop_codon:yes gene_type:complete
MNASRERQYRFIDPNNIDTTGVEPPAGTNAECLADSLLDIIQLSMHHGMNDEDVDEALEVVQEHWAQQNRSQFKLHRAPP